MSSGNRSAACAKCMWADVCGFGVPCQHYTPYNYEELIASREERRRKEMFAGEWERYIEYCDDENTSY